MATAAELLAQRHPASFEGFPFVVQGGSTSGSNSTIVDQVMGLGSRTRFAVAGEDTMSIQAEIVDDRFVARFEELRSLFKFLKSDDKTGVLVHPWEGVKRVVPVSWRFDWQPNALNHLRFSVEFGSAELPSSDADAGMVSQTPDQLVITMGESARLMALEPIPAAQLEALREPLGIPATLEGADYAQATATRLGARADITTAGVPLMIQQLGITARSADLGELTVNARDGLRSLIIREARVSNSLGLLQLREDWTMYLGGLGVNAFGVEVTKPNGILQGIHTATSTNRLAQLNRDDVRNWTIRQKARV